MTSLTPQQAAVVEATASSGPNILVNSCAGSGKTSTLVAAVTAAQGNQPGAAIGVFSFGKDPAKELEKRLPRGIDSSTTHSLALRAWTRSTGKKFQPDLKKTFELMDETIGDFDCPGMRQAVGLAKAIGYYPEGMPGLSASCAIDRESLASFLDDYSIDWGQVEHLRAMDALDEILRRSAKRSWSGLMDFDDMIYMPAIHGCRMLHSSGRPFDLLCVDEAQDLNRVQRILFTNARAGRYVFVGDRGQSIYGFRGADHESMDNILAEFSCTEMELTVSFRCPQQVVARAKPYYSSIEPHPDAPEGVVEDIPGFDIASFLVGDAVLCRNNAPLVRTAFALIASGIPAKVMGRDIGGVICNQIKRAAKNDPGAPLKAVIERIQHEIASKRQNALLKGNDNQVSNLDDRLACIFAVADGLDKSSTARDLVRRVETIFDDGRSPITLSTIHKAKGLEWERVWLLDFDLIGARARTAKQLRQEHNLAYVGITRAKHELRFVSSRKENEDGF